MTQKIGGKVSRKIHFPLPQFDSGKESFFNGFHDNLLTFWIFEFIRLREFSKTVFSFWRPFLFATTVILF